MKQRDILKQIEELENNLYPAVKIQKLEEDLQSAYDKLIDLIKESLNSNQGTRKQYKVTCEMFGKYNDKDKYIITLKDIYSVKKGILPAFKADRVIMSLKNFYENRKKSKFLC